MPPSSVLRGGHTDTRQREDICSSAIGNSPNNSCTNLQACINMRSWYQRAHVHMPSKRRRHARTASCLEKLHHVFLRQEAYDVALEFILLPTRQQCFSERLFAATTDEQCQNRDQILFGEMNPNYYPAKQWINVPEVAVCCIYISLIVWKLYP